MTFLVVSSSFSCQMMTERMKRPLNAKMERFSFNGRFFGNDHGMTNFSFRHHSVAKRARTKEDGMKKVGWFSMGTVVNLGLDCPCLINVGGRGSPGQIGSFCQCTLLQRRTVGGTVGQG